MMTAEVINIQVKQESSDANHQNTTATKVTEPNENGVQVSEETTSQVETAPQAVLVQAGTTLEGGSVSASEQLQRMIQQQYLVNLIQFQQSMLQVCFIIVNLNLYIVCKIKSFHTVKHGTKSQAFNEFMLTAKSVSFS